MQNHQFSLELIPHAVQNAVVEQRARDGYINATALCKAAGKLWSDYRRNSTTVEFFAALEADMGIPISELVQSVKGGRSLAARNLGPSASRDSPRAVVLSRVCGKSLALGGGLDGR
jgi:hypothetical protein